MTSILVTGASGFIGRNLVTQLRNCHNKVTEVNSLHGDIADQITWEGFESADVLVHLAGSTFVPDSWSRPADFLKVNLMGTVHALDYCRMYGSKLVYLSSYMYGNADELPIPETAPLMVSNPYALSKKLAEDVCRFYADFYNLKIIILRPFNVYGPGQNPQFLIPSLMNQACNDTSIKVKDLEPKRDYIYVDDLVGAIIKAIDIDIDFDIFNIGTGASYAVSELIEKIQSIQKTNHPVCTEGERRVGEIMDTKADISKAKTILGWMPKYSLFTGLKKMINSQL